MKTVFTASLVASSALILGGGCGGGDDAAPDPRRDCDRSAAGHICTIAGTGDTGYSGEDGDALDARLALVMDMLGAPDGTLYIVDWNNHRIRHLTADGKIHFVAGNGELGGSVDDPETGDFNHPTGLLWDPTKTKLYMAAWHNSQVLVLDPATGLTTPSCGDGRRAYFGDDASAAASSLNLPASLAWDPQGNLTIMDQANQVIRKVDAQGNIHRIAGQCIVDQAAPVGPGACAPGVEPVACPGGSGVTTCGDPATTCGIACAPSYNGDELPALETRIAQQFGQAADPGGRIAYDKAGNLYFADVSNNLIRMIDTNGIVHRVAGQPPVNGAAQGGYAGDGGPALDAKINHPIDLAFADDGTLFFTDVYNHCVRAIAPDKTIRTVAGVCGQKGYAGDDGDATKALLNRPYGIEWVAPKTLYIADTGNSVVRVVALP